MISLAACIGCRHSTSRRPLALDTRALYAINVWRQPPLNGGIEVLVVFREGRLNLVRSHRRPSPISTLPGLAVLGRDEASTWAGERHGSNNSVGANDDQELATVDLRVD